MENISFVSIKALQKLIAQGTIKPHESIDFFKSRSNTLNPKLNALIEILDHNTQAQGPLTGIPGIIKNNICIKDTITTAASNILRNYQAPYDATVVSKLKTAGAPLIATANLDEFAMGSSTETSAFGVVKNPWNTNCVAGGSSGGSAAAVAAGMAPWSLGTSTGGSVRQPAAFCGIVGFKPTYGLASRFGLIAYGSSLDVPGIFTRSAEDAAIILEIIAGNDPSDGTTLSTKKYDFTSNLDSKLHKKIKIGLIKNAFNTKGIDSEIAQASLDAAKELEKQGCELIEIDIPVLDYSAAAYFIISRAEAASNLARFDGIRYGVRSEKAEKLADVYGLSRHDGFGPEVRKRIMVGNYVLSAGHAGQFYENAKRIVRIMQQELNNAFKKVDILMMPTTSTTAFEIGKFAHNKLEMDLQDYFTCPANLTGIPAISVPCGFGSNRLPIGVQFMGNHAEDGLLLQIAHQYQLATNWHTIHPTI